MYLRKHLPVWRCTSTADFTVLTFYYYTKMSTGPLHLSIGKLVRENPCVNALQDITLLYKAKR